MSLFNGGRKTKEIKAGDTRDYVLTGWSLRIGGDLWERIIGFRRDGNDIAIITDGNHTNYFLADEFVTIRTK